MLKDKDHNSINQLKSIWNLLDTDCGLNIPKQLAGMVRIFENECYQPYEDIDTAIDYFGLLVT